MVVVFLAFWSLQGHGFTWCLGGNGLELVSSSRHETALSSLRRFVGLKPVRPSSPHDDSVRIACAGSIARYGERQQRGDGRCQHEGGASKGRAPKSGRLAVELLSKGGHAPPNVKLLLPPRRSGGTPNGLGLVSSRGEIPPSLTPAHDSGQFRRLGVKAVRFKSGARNLLNFRVRLGGSVVSADTLSKRA
jgi:hypothetical protein